MGLMDLIRPKRDEVRQTTSALEAAREPEADDGAVNRLVQVLLRTGLDGTGPLSSAIEVAEEARAEAGGDLEAAVDKIARGTLIRGGIGGFVTGLGGFVTMPIALPINVAEFYIQATRMVGAIATLRGYEIAKPEIRTAILLTLIGSNADDVLKQAGMSTGGGRLASLALKRMPPAAIMIVNKAIGFRLMRGLGEKVLSRLGRGVPVVGGLVGGGLDAYMMRKIAQQARKEFPLLAPTPAA